VCSRFHWVLPRQDGAGLVPTCLDRAPFTTSYSLSIFGTFIACIQGFRINMGSLFGFGFMRLRQACDDHWSLLVLPMSCLVRFSLFLFLLSFAFPSYAIKFNLPAYRWPQRKCLWNPAHDNTLVIVTANIGPGPGQRTDIEIIDSSPQKNVYLRKKGIKTETRLAITTHSEGEVGVCFYNYLEQSQYNFPSTLHGFRVLTLE